MRRTDRSLFDEIERGAANGSMPLADVLRKCVILGGQASSASLRDWARQELNGYDRPDDLPQYRRPGAVIRLDGLTSLPFQGAYKVTGQGVSPSQLPDFVQERVGEWVPLTGGIGEVEALREQARSKGGTVKLALPDNSGIARYMNYEAQNPGQHIEALYWEISEAAIAGVIDSVRTTLAELVAEMRAVMPDSMELPNSEIADQAVHVVVEGGERHQITVNAAQSSGVASAQAAQAADAGTVQAAQGSGSEAPSKWIATTGVGTVILVVVTVALWQGWHVF